MRLAAGIILVSVIIVASSSPSEACGGHRSRCRGHHHRSAAPVMMQTSYASVAPSMTSASPQMAQASATSQVAAVAVAAPTAPTLPAEVVPTYEYTAAGGNQPAYYYTYDNSGKLIVAQWVDWVFRGGRAAGEPAPPLPIIGALRNR